MAKSIHLSKVDKDALLARATGATATKQLRVPQPAQPTGVSGELPLPAGRLVGMRTARSLTPTERATLTHLGWTEDVPIPENMADLVAAAEAEQRAAVDPANLPLPVDPRQAPVQVETQDIRDLDPAGQAKFRTLIATAVADQEARSRVDADRARIQGLGEAAVQAYDLAHTLAQQQEAAIVNDLAPPPPDDADPAAAAAGAAPTAAPAAPVAAPAAAASDTGTDVALAHCPHCAWPLHMADVDEPAHAVKMAFLHSLLGQKCFVHDTEIFGGTIQVTFRALTTRELDTLYKQAYRDLKVGRIETEKDFWDRLNRYRLFLQLQGIRSLADAQIVHEFPDGLSAETNDLATTYWTGDEDDPEETLLPLIEAHIVGTALKTETMFRVVNGACNQFNRMVAKLEAMADNGPFWQATEPLF